MQIPILNMISQAINSCFQWFHDVFAKLYIFRDLFTSVFILITIYRFLLHPLFKGGVGSSDKVKNDKKSDSNGGDK